ncbi:NAD(P)/FAD-dependent oxidoreductase [Cellulomonas sp. URHE0023]|uniref:phytoene desaturase family protein n=1 Tax=Cellulomonas sp. URHE0023 TaxID=1380354 RepID=UPI000488A801|nr:NAD(P)/FAD-dependent oxidoreductase [Cellulomonas sp. URHE0023]
MTEVDAVVVGSGPNGLAAAVTLARAGLSVQVLEAQAVAGGGARTLELGLADGVVHDICSAVHPMAVASPFLREFDLPARGVELLQPEVAYANPLDGGRAALAYRSLDRTASALGVDGSAWRQLLRPLVDDPDGVVAVALGDHRRVPRQLGTAAAFGVRLAEQGTFAWAARFRDQEAAALLTGVGAHAITRLPSLSAAGTALLLASLAHAGGWPVPRGGSGAIVGALLADVQMHGGTVVTGTRVDRAEDLPPARAYLFDTSPRTAVRVLGQRLAGRVARGLVAFPRGRGAAAKVDLVLSGPVPWAHPEVALAGTVHLGGSRVQTAAAEAAVASGGHAERPTVLVSDPGVVDPSRVTPAGLRPFWAYAHVPAGSTLDVTEAVLAQVERFAPGFRDLVVASRCIPAARLAEHDANLVGGDISGGGASMYRMLARPRLAWDPYVLVPPRGGSRATGAAGAWLCSSSTPPGPGVHGLPGWYAARRALRDGFGLPSDPSLAPWD